MSLSNEIVLRPRFKFDVKATNQQLLASFEQQRTKQDNFVVNRVEDHVFIRFPKHQQHYWSPQLHLEINQNEEGHTTVHGLFGPNPTIWTMFMFLHFVVAGLFIALAIWTYSKMTLDEPFAIPLFLTLFMIVIWFALYFIGRMGKTKGKPDMYKLHAFMRDILQAEDIHSI